MEPNLGVEFEGTPTPAGRSCVFEQKKANRLLTQLVGAMNVKDDQLKLCELEDLLWEAQDTIQNARASCGAGLDQSLQCSQVGAYEAVATEILRGKIAALRKVPTPAEQEEAQKREEM